MSKVKVPNISGVMVEVDMPRRAAAWRLMTFWSSEQRAGLYLASPHALIVDVLTTGRSPGDGSLRDAGDAAFDRLLEAGWTPATMAATALAFIEAVPVIYPPLAVAADFSKAQQDPATST